MVLWSLDWDVEIRAALEVVNCSTEMIGWLSGCKIISWVELKSKSWERRISGSVSPSWRKFKREKFDPVSCGENCDEFISVKLTSLSRFSEVLEEDSPASVVWWSSSCDWSECWERGCSWKAEATMVFICRNCPGGGSSCSWSSSTASTADMGREEERGERLGMLDTSGRNVSVVRPAVWVWVESARLGVLNVKWDERKGFFVVDLGFVREGGKSSNLKKDDLFVEFSPFVLN